MKKNQSVKKTVWIVVFAAALSLLVSACNDSPKTTVPEQDPEAVISELATAESLIPNTPAQPEKQLVVIHLNDYLGDPHLYGTNGQGTVQQDPRNPFVQTIGGFDDKAFLAEISRVYGATKASMMKSQYRDMWRGEWTPGKGLKNGDVISFHWSGDFNLLKDSWGLVLEGEDATYTVAGLPD